MVDFLVYPDMKKLVENPTMPPKGTRQTLMFSATFAEDVQTLAMGKIILLLKRYHNDIASFRFFG